jgi:biotin carboxyl carrier protein
VSDEPVGQAPANAGPEPADGIEALTEEVLPALIARLRASRLGELEVRSDGWRIRLRRDTSVLLRPAATSDDGQEPGELAGSMAVSPAVGYFTPASVLVVGASVQAGDLLGTIDVLGIVQEVNAPVEGLISRVLVEDGQAVEYGQALAEVDPLETAVDEEAD